MTTIRRRFTRDDRAGSIYQYLVAEVPRGSRGLTVTLDYERGDSILDLGLIGPHGFCGWSGSERREVTVTEEWATPGYVPGPVTGGWQIVLGLYRVAPAGVHVTVGVETPTTLPARPDPPALPPPPRRRPLRSLPARPGHEWLAGDFHSHTVHSDGALEIVELAVLAASRGLDVLAVTDHNTVSHHAHLGDAATHAGIVLVPGQEVTTDLGHANVFGDCGWIDFREPPDRWRAEADARGAVMAINHPWAWSLAWRMALSDPAPLVEMWHWTWDRSDPVPLADWTRFGERAIGGSDFHRHGGGAELGAPTTWLECADRSVEAVLDAMVNGRVALSASPDGPVLLRDGDELIPVDAEGCELVDDELGARLVADGRVVAIAVR